ncbi:MAG: T9SS type A sorting domain-containing protein [Bacteroidetes bacterium]|nr:T9SS type A sorting domain-containing protein [Bacteroidota bacterium]
MKRTIFTFFTLLLLLPLSFGQVTIGGVDYGTDLQGAIDATAEGDTVNIDGVLNIDGNINVHNGATTVTILGQEGAMLVFADEARIICEGEVVRTIDNVDLDGGATGDRGGVIKMGGNANLTLKNLSLSGGTSESHGGGIALGGGGTILTVDNCSLSDNKCEKNGGAIFADGNATVNIYNSKIFQNVAAKSEGDGKGAAIAVVGCPDNGLYAENCAFYDNYSGTHGGVFIFEAAKALVVNSTITGNECRAAGGVAFMWVPVDIKFVNTTVAYNTTKSDGNAPAMWNNHDANTLEFDNCIFYQNRRSSGSGTANDIHSNAAVTMTINNSIISAYTEENITINGEKNLLGAAAQNIGLAEAINADGVLTFSDDSPAVNLGNGTYLSDLSVATDQLGHTRNFAGGRVDAGAWEANAGLAEGFVKIGEVDYGTDLQAAIDATVDDDVVSVFGILNIGGNINIHNGAANITLQGQDGATLIFADEARLILVQEVARTIDNIDLVGGATGDRGGVIKMSGGADLTLKNLSLSGGTSESHGGGIAIGGGGTTLITDNCSFSGNKCEKNGGAIFADGNASVKLYNSQFYENQAAKSEGDGKGAAIAMVGCQDDGLYAENCAFYDNYSGTHGGVFIFEVAKAVVVNTTITGNECRDAGGVAFMWGPVDAKFVNSTIAYNKTKSETNSPGFWNNHDINNLEFYNCILYENRRLSGEGTVNDILSNPPVTIKISNSVVSAYTDNITIDGAFNLLGADITNLGLAPAGTPVGLLPVAEGSQAINLGNATFIQDLGVSTDQLGNPRNFAAGRVDAGAIEFGAGVSEGQVVLNGVNYGTNLQEAIDSTSEVNGNQILIFGTINIAEGINLHNGTDTVTLSGQEGATLIFADEARFIYNGGDSEVIRRTIENIDILGGATDDKGAVVKMSGMANLTLNNVSISGGTSNTSHGGGIALGGAGTTLTANNCSFYNNKCERNGGAIFADGNATVKVYNTDFYGNLAAKSETDGKGGAIAMVGCPDDGLYAENCSFFDNNSGTHGGVFIFESSKSVLINTTIFNNGCRDAGGVAFIWAPSQLTMINCTVVNNKTKGEVGRGPALKNVQSTNEIKIYNSFFYNNTSLNGEGPARDIDNDQPTTTLATNSILQGGANENTTITGSLNIMTSAVVSPGIPDVLNGDYVLPLDETSQALNLGESVYLGELGINYDQTGAERNFEFDRVDAGAYELQGFSGSVGVVHSDSSKFTSYTGLVMSGYQGWFATPGDGSGNGWKHYQKNGVFEPGSCTIDFWPDMRETDENEKYATAFTYANGDTAYVYSPYSPPTTIHRHFRWMDEYGVDGVFMQRFVTDMMGSAAGKNRMNGVLSNAIQGAEQYDRALCLMYDLSGIVAETEEEKNTVIEAIKTDWIEMLTSAEIALTTRGSGQNYLYHNGKPLLAIWGVGFDGDRKYDLDFVQELLDYFQNDPIYGECSILLGVPTYWREGLHDSVEGAEHAQLLEMLKSVDIVLPWHTGRFNRTDFSNNKYKDIITADIAWCDENNLDYAPVVMPGFSWRNLKGDISASSKPREGGMYYWDMTKAAIEGGINMVYVGMFDEIDEGTQIAKTDNNPPDNPIPFRAYSTDDNPEDHYLWITGEVAKALRGEFVMGSELPARADETGITAQISYIRSLDTVGQTTLIVDGGDGLYYADPYPVPDGAPTLGAARDTNLFANTFLTDTLVLNLDRPGLYVRLVQVDANDMVVGFKAFLLDETVIGTKADSTGFTDQAGDFDASQTIVGYTEFVSTPTEGNTYWATAIQDTPEYEAPFLGAARDAAVYSMAAQELFDGLKANDGDYIPLIEVDANDEVVGFKVFLITPDKIARLIAETDLFQSTFSIAFSGTDLDITVEAAEGYELYRTELSATLPATPIYRASYDLNAEVFPVVAITESTGFVEGQKIGFVEAKDGRLVAFRTYSLNSIPAVSVPIVAEPDYVIADASVLSAGDGLPEGHKVYVNLSANPTADPPRIGTDYAEVAPVYTQELNAEGNSVPAQAGDVFFVIEVDATNAVIGFSSVSLTADVISVAANPALDKLQSEVTVSIIGVTAAGMVDVTVTPADGYTVYSSGVISEISRDPVLSSMIGHNVEYSEAVTGAVAAGEGNQLVFIEMNADGELTGINVFTLTESAAAVYYVADTGSDDNDGSQYNPFASVAKAVSLIPDGNLPLEEAATIFVSGNVQMLTPETSDGLFIDNKSFKMIGAGAGTTLNAAPNNRHLNIVNGEYFFKYITFTGGQSSSEDGGAAVFIHGAAGTKAVFEDCKFTDNECMDDGGRLGAVRVCGVDATFTNCSFTGNYGRIRGGAISVMHGCDNGDGDFTVVFNGCYIADNISKENDFGVEGHGGAMHIQDSEAGSMTLKIINTVIRNNTANAAGGALFVEGSGMANSTIDIINSIIVDNRGHNVGNGHGIRLTGGTVNLYNSLLWDNELDGAKADITNDPGSPIPAQSSYVEFLLNEVPLEGDNNITGEREDIYIKKVALPAGPTTSLFIEKEESFAINMGDPAYLTAEGIDYDATGASRNASDGNIEAGPTEYNPLVFDKLPEINIPFADVIVPKNAPDHIVDLTQIFVDSDDDTFTFAVEENNNEAAVNASVQGTNLVLAFPTDGEGNAMVRVSGTTNGKSVSDDFAVMVGYAPYVVNPIAEFSIPHLDGGDFDIDMSAVFADDDDPVENIILSVLNNTDQALVTSAAFDVKTLKISVTPSVQGSSVITVRAKSGIRTALTTITIAIGKPPVVANPINGVAVKVNADPVVFDLTNVFSDPDDEDDLIEKSISDNTNPELVTAEISDNQLTFSFAADQSGTAVVTLKALSNGLAVFHPVNVVVSDAALIVLNPIPTVTVEKNAPDMEIDISSLFYYQTDPEADLQLKVDDNTNVGLVSTNIADEVLTLSFAADDEGSAEITIEGSVAGQTITYTFTVGVGDVDIITIKSVPTNVEIPNDPEQEISVPLDDVFEVAGNPDAEIVIDIVTLSSFTLINAYIDDNVLYLSSISGELGSVDITLSGVFGNAYKEVTFGVDVVFGTSTDDLATIEDLQVYPNPANDHVYVEFTNLKGEEVIFSLYDVAGKLLVQDTEGISLGSNKFRLNVAGIAPGVYSLKCKVGEKIGVIKLVKK